MVLRYIKWLLFAFAVVALPARQATADDAQKKIDAIVDMLADDDKDTVAIGLEQVREKLPGREATLRFAGVLPKLKPEAQVALLAALADRGDKAAHDAVLEVARGGDDACKAAALRALGALGGPDDVPALLSGIAARGELHDGAAAGLKRLIGPQINAAIVAEAKKAAPATRAEMIGILVARHAVDTIPDFLAEAHDKQPAIRAAAVDAIGQLAGPEQIPDLFDLALAAPTAAERANVELALVAVCDRTGDAEHRAAAALAVYAKLDEMKKWALLPSLGRLGGKSVLVVVNAAQTSTDPFERASAVGALCNWPDGSVAPRLLKLAKDSADSAQQRQALEALIRVAPLPDKRPPAEKLKMVQAAMSLATSDADRALILRRASAIRTMDTVHWVLGYFDDPALAQAACFSMVEMAHHRELRSPNKAEFALILDRVMALSKDPVVVERAKRYKNEQTFKLEKKR